MFDNTITFQRRRVRAAWLGMTGLSLLAFAGIWVLWPDIRGFAFGLSMGLWTYSGGFLLWKVMALSAGHDGRNLRLVVGDPADAGPLDLSSKSVEIGLFLIKVVDHQNRWGSLALFLAYALAGGLGYQGLAMGAVLGACIHFGPKILREICAAGHRVAYTQRLEDDDVIAFRLAAA